MEEDILDSLLKSCTARARNAMLSSVAYAHSDGRAPEAPHIILGLWDQNGEAKEIMKANDIGALDISLEFPEPRERQGPPMMSELGLNVMAAANQIAPELFGVDQIDELHLFCCLIVSDDGKALWSRLTNKTEPEKLAHSIILAHRKTRLEPTPAPELQTPIFKLAEGVHQKAIRLAPEIFWALLQTLSNHENHVAINGLPKDAKLIGWFIDNEGRIVFKLEHPYFPLVKCGGPLNDISEISFCIDKLIPLKQDTKSECVTLKRSDITKPSQN